MHKTITFTDSSELQWAATAYIRRTSLFVRLFVFAIAAVAALVYVRFVDQMGGIVKLLFRFFLAYVTFVFIAIAWAKLKALKRKPTSVQSHVTFTKKGFNCKTDGEVASVSWSKVYWVRREQDFWAIHYTVDGREAFVAIPSDAIDEELSAFIRENTPTDA